MTRKDFELIARVISDSRFYLWQPQIAKAFADELATTNTRFDRERFLEACNVTEDRG
mgnify:CR=1 FL=1